MIYLVTNNERYKSNELYTVISVEESLEKLNQLDIIGVDTETTGLDCHTCTTLSLQLGCYDWQVVIDALTVNIASYKSLLESNKLFLFWNAAFDLKILFNYRIIPYNVYDGMIAERLLWLGYPIILKKETWDLIKEPRYDPIPGSNKYCLYTNLKKAGELYCNIELDKTIRGKIIYEGLNESTIEYSALDVKYLEEIYNKQNKCLSNRGLLKAMKYENSFIISLAYMEYCGVRINQDKWKEKVKRDTEQLHQYEDLLNQWILDNWSDCPYISDIIEYSLFEDSTKDKAPKISINWNSTKQVIPIFKHFNIPISIPDKENGGDKDSINEKVIAPYKNVCSLIPLYLEFKGFEKSCNSFGENILRRINKETSRLYTRFYPLGTDTARISSGGKENSGDEYTNFLNFPSDELTRSCFEAEEGNRWISIDYSGQESFIMGDVSGDKEILKELNYGDKDLHTLTAKIIFDYIPKDMTAEEVKKKFHKERKQAKGYEFAFNYSGNANTIKRNFGLTDEEANRIYNSYMSGFSGLKKYQEFRRKDWKEKGYIDLCPQIGYKANIFDFKYLMELKEEQNDPSFWESYRYLKQTDPDNPLIEHYKYYNKRCATSDRKSVNYPIQHRGALCYKASMINFFKYLREKDLLFKVLITVTPYDEINCEAPESIAEEVASKLHEIMVNVGAYFCKKCKLDADISRNEDGSLPTFWIH